MYSFYRYIPVLEIIKNLSHFCYLAVPVRYRLGICKKNLFFVTGTGLPWLLLREVSNRSLLKALIQIRRNNVVPGTASPLLMPHMYLRSQLSKIDRIDVCLFLDSRLMFNTVVFAFGVPSLSTFSWYV